MKLEFCDLRAQYQRISKVVIDNIEKVLESGKYIIGPEVTELEDKLRKYVGSKYGIACGNGTDALTLALMAIDLKPGDEVIMPAFTYFATAEACAILGGKPVFIDVDENTFNLNVSLIEDKITPNTKAIIHVSLFGQCADIDSIRQIAKKHNLYLIEDAAQSFGATYKGNKSCFSSDISCTSFFPSKPLGCYGDGGMCFTNDNQLASKLQSLRVHGQKQRYYHQFIGMNSRLDTIQAAILLAKFEIFNEEIALRQQVARVYNEMLEGFIATPYISEFNSSVYAQYTLKHHNRDSIIDKMKEKGIPTMVYYPVILPMQNAILNLSPNPEQVKVKLSDEYPVSTKLAETVFSLPMHPYLTYEQQEFITTELKKFI